MPTPEQWKQFKEWRKKEIEKVESSEPALRIKAITDPYKDLPNEVKPFIEIPAFLIVEKEQLESIIPPETVEGCLDWLSKD